MAEAKRSKLHKSVPVEAQNYIGKLIHIYTARLDFLDTRNKIPHNLSPLTLSKKIARLRIFNRLVSALLCDENEFANDVEELINYLEKTDSEFSRSADKAGIFKNIFRFYGNANAKFIFIDARENAPDFAEIQVQLALKLPQISANLAVICIIDNAETKSVPVRDSLDNAVAKYLRAGTDAAVIYL